MNLFKQYVDYLKDNPNHYWFRRKILGWGWTPATREGWLVTLGFIVVIVGNAFLFEKGIIDGSYDPMLFVGITVGLIALFLIIVWRTGEPPKWQWGFPKKEER